jgi:hypothetical protein
MGVIVARYMYNDAGEEVESSGDSTYWVYEISVDRLIEGTSATSMTVSKFSSESEIVLV